MAFRLRTPLALLVALPIVVLWCPSLASPALADEAVDMTAVRDKMTLVTDGKGHYVAFAPLSEMSERLFYGDGKRFYLQRVFGGGSEGDIRFSRSFWEPRVQGHSGAEFSFQDKKYSVACGTRTTELKLVPAAEAKALVAAAVWLQPLWKRRAYLLARDDMARYYYVDRMREPEQGGAFRLFMGPKGSLKLQKMTNVVSDTQGDIFSTKSGSLRLISGQAESSWVEGKAKRKLTSVPVQDNAQLIYTDLGVYSSERLGTPCDDL